MHSEKMFIYIYIYIYIFMVILSISLQSMNVLKELLSNDTVAVTEVRFRTDDGIDGISTEFLVSSQTLTLYNVILCSIQQRRLCIFY